MRFVPTTAAPECSPRLRRAAVQRRTVEIATAALRVSRAAPSRLGRRLLDFVPAALLVLCVAGILVRVCFRDSLPLLAVFYYAAPTPILAGLALVAGLIWLGRRRHLFAAGALALTIACGLWSYWTMWFAHASDDRPANARVLFWNVARGAAGWSNIARAIQAQDVDLIGLVEAGDAPDGMAAIWNTALPQYHYFIDDCGIALLAKGEVSHCGHGTLAQRGSYEHCRVRFRDQDVHVFVVDLRGEPQRSRRRPLAALTELLRPLADKPVVVMGDFNTPTDSVWLNELRRDYQNAFEAAGDGYIATWPAPLPVLTIDQIWTTRGVAARSCEHHMSWLSDHRAVLARLAFE